MTNKPFIVGITGGSASGKTSFLSQLLHAFADDQICLISQDNYYRELQYIPRDQNGIHNFDLPETIDHHRFAEHLRRLHQGEEVQTLEYTFNNPNVVPKMLTYRPTPIIIVEGLFVFHFKDVADQLDLKIFIDAKNKTKLERRILRDQTHRGITIETIMYQWENHVLPTYKQFIKPYKGESDIVIPNNRHFEKGLDVVVSYLKTKLPAR
ncbi:uridine kinase [Nibrella saemangeumensis]|uniref:Uridine kinase n=1 Tax=Nibrella saemangeumensis TaxID=1084526 RepID=A0ABP8MY71_9BACT